jgi:hypothetical protein
VCLLVTNGSKSKFSTSQEGIQAENIILSTEFWNSVEFCLRASQPILIALRIADGDETPAALEIMTAMDKAKATIKEALKNKGKLLLKYLYCCKPLYYIIIYLYIVLYMTIYI